jgi:hypothetical protein
LSVFRSLSRAERALILLFLLTLPFAQTRVRGDGIGYYAYARSLLIDHNLQFKGDWTDPSTLPFLVQADRAGHIQAVLRRTKTGHIPNFYTVGPALLWSPFLLLTHGGVLLANRLGWGVAADGFSRPYLLTMAWATALYGFLGLLLSFRLTRQYVSEQWALLATMGIWFASSLPVYMYVDPAWSHAQSAFTVALFLWYWNLMRESQRPIQWLFLGLISGLMLDVYFANAVLLVVLLVDLAFRYFRSSAHPHSRTLLVPGQFLWCVGAWVTFLPTLIVRRIVFGNPLALGGYANKPWHFDWRVIPSMLFSSQHGLFSWTPILALSIIGICLLCKSTPERGLALLCSFIGFCALLSVYPWWDGVSSFGSRFLVSLTPVYLVGLAVFFAAGERLWGSSRGTLLRAATVCALLVLWNLGLVFQWSTGLMPSVGSPYWNEVLYNQFRVVPVDIVRAAQSRFALGRATSLQRVD